MSSKTASRTKSNRKKVSRSKCKLVSRSCGQIKSRRNEQLDSKQKEIEQGESEQKLQACEQELLAGGMSSRTACRRKLNRRKVRRGTLQAGEQEL